MDRLSVAFLMLLFLGCGLAMAQPSTAVPPGSANPNSLPHQENITVEGSRMKAAPTARYETAPIYTPKGSGAATPEPSVMPHVYCNQALQNDIGGQPGTSQTLTNTCD